MRIDNKLSYIDLEYSFTALNLINNLKAATRKFIKILNAFALVC